MKTKSKTFIAEALTNLDNEKIDEAVITEDSNNAEYIKQRVYELTDNMYELMTEAKEMGFESIQFALEDAIDELVHRVSLIDYPTEEALIEAISPEDEAENELLKSIFRKTSKKVNSALTPEEKAVMQKYNITRYGGWGKPTYLSVGDYDIMNHYIKPKINYVDRARKIKDRRDYKRYSDAAWRDWAANGETYNSYYADKSRYPNQALANARDMTADYRRMKDALSNSKEYKNKLAKLEAEYDKKRDALLNDYHDRLRSLYNDERSDSEYYSKAAERQQNDIDAIKQKHNM